MRLRLLHFFHCFDLLFSLTNDKLPIFSSPSCYLITFSIPFICVSLLLRRAHLYITLAGNACALPRVAAAGVSRRGLRSFWTTVTNAILVIQGAVQQRLKALVANCSSMLLIQSECMLCNGSTNSQPVCAMFSCRCLVPLLF